jgi:hypothetical protein
MVREADPNFTRTSLRPMIYEFSNGRVFIEPSPVYTPYDITDDLGAVITDDLGNVINQT